MNECEIFILCDKKIEDIKKSPAFFLFFNPFYEREREGWNFFYTHTQAYSIPILNEYIILRDKKRQNTCCSNNWITD